MLGYAVKEDGSWRMIDFPDMELKDGEVFQDEVQKDN